MKMYGSIPQKFKEAINYGLPQAILFDWDNTIINMREVYKNATINLINKINLNDWSVEIISSSHHQQVDHDFLKAFFLSNNLTKDEYDKHYYNVIVTNEENNGTVEKLRNSYEYDYLKCNLVDSSNCNPLNLNNLDIKERDLIAFTHYSNSTDDFHPIDPTDIIVPSKIEILNSIVNFLPPEELWLLPSLDIHKESFHQNIFHGAPFVMHISCKNEEIFKIGEEILRNYISKSSHLGEIQIFNGVIKLFDFCVANNIKMFVVSNKSGEIVRNESKFLNISHYFEEIVGQGDTDYMKPRIEPSLYALKNHPEISLEKCWFVGDSMFDIDCARNMNCLGVAVHYRCMLQDTLNLKCTSEITDVLANIQKGLL
jgi:phosphoglycolate phosphatase-like HAD superfamily hydrolase